jgi:Fe-S oxidoreductase
VLKSFAGIDPRRPLPRFRTQGSAAAAGANALTRALRVGSDDLRERPGVAIWVDSFSDAFGTTALPALVKVLLAAGFAPQIITDEACCGQTWIATGQWGIARAKLRHAVDVLAPIAASGLPIVGLEPSCLATWRSSAARLLPDDPRVAQVADAMTTLAGLLSTVTGWCPPDLSGHTVVAQPHCHQSAVLGWKDEAALLKRTGADVVTVGGCCGFAGDFGMAKGHYDISVKVFRHDLGPAIDQAGPDAIILADGFSCRHQVEDLAHRQAMTLAELLAAHL